MATYGVTTNTETVVSQLVADEHHHIKRATMKASCGDLSRGTVLEMTSYMGGTWQQLGVATPTYARGVLYEDVTDSTSTQIAQVLTQGMLKEDDLIWPAGMTTKNRRYALQTLQDRGMPIQEAILSVSTSTTTTTSTTSTTS